MQTLWFCILATMIAIYVVLDGYDLGAGIIHLWIARTEEERAQVLETIHPLWDGNEVWLVAAGTTLFFAFPKLYAISFSGFYLPLVIVLWLLILRGIAIEFRDRIRSEAWQPFWDGIFCAASSALAIVFGAALGNVIRGVPFASDGRFFLPLWTNFRVNGLLGILDWYTISVGLTAWLTLMEQGSLWVAFRTEGVVQQNARRLARRVWPILLVMTWVISAMSFYIQTELRASFGERPWGVIFPILGIVGLAGARFWNRTGGGENSKTNEGKAFLSSCVFILGMLTSAAFGLYPIVLPSTTSAAATLTVINASAPEQGLRLGLYWFIPGISLAIFYTAFAHWKFSGKVHVKR